MDGPWHSITADDALLKLKSSREGLTPSEAQDRLKETGPNLIARRGGPSLARLFLSQFKNYMILILGFAALVSYISGETTNAYVVLGIILFISLLGFAQEYRAERAMEALREMVSPEADVFRSGRIRRIPARDLVPGDVIYVEAGARVPADARIIESTALQAIEAALTGESLPTDKSSEPLDPKTPLADRKNMLFMGTAISYGNGRAAVTATGKETELGRISSLIQERPEDPPLKAKLQQMAKQLAVLVLAAAAAVFFVEVSRGSPVLSTLIVASALAVAGVPESLPFVVTLTLAYGTQVMARKNAIIRSLPAVETLGSTTAICTDKTGTLTSGEMTVREIRTYRTVEVTGEGYEPKGDFLEDKRKVDPEEHQDLMMLLKVAVLSNNADLEEQGGRWRVVGDPTEGALTVAAAKAGILEHIRNGHRRIAEHPFDSDRKRMTTVGETPEGKRRVVSMKGAPEVVIERCTKVLSKEGLRALTDSDREAILQHAEEMANRALRVLAMAWKDLDQEEPLDRESAESGLTFIGLVGMMDPPRKEAKEAIKTCIQAGIRPIMITGDHRLTAVAIGKELGIGSESADGSEIDQMDDSELQIKVEQISVFARATAEHKVRLVQALKKQGHVVAMTGDGVNDAPALKAADIGVAMGITGTEVAKEASDMVITDDNFATIVSAVEEGRRIYDNLRKGSSYLLSCNFAELMTIFTGVMIGLPIPLLALQILWINIIAEEFPAVGLSVEPSQGEIMKRRPRSAREPILSRALLIYTIGISAVIFIGSLGLYILYLPEGLEYARTVTFACLGAFTLYNAYSSRSLHDSIFRMDPRKNKKLIAGMLASVVAILCAIYLPFMQSIFETVPLDRDSWLLVLVTSFSVVIAAEALKRFTPNLNG